MRFRRTINLWADGVQEALESGEMTIQRGQWCRCGTQGKRCRYVGQLGRGIWVTHWQGSPKATEAKFREAVRVIASRSTQKETTP